MPTIRPTGLGARSSSSASVWAMASAAGGVVGAVEPQLRAGGQQPRQRAVVEPLHACRPAHIEKAALDGGVGDAELAQLQRGGDGGAGVDELVLSHQRRQGQIQQPFGALIHEAAALLEGLVILAPQHERRLHFAGARADSGERLLRLARDYRGHAGLEDAGLLGRDQRDAVPQPVGVIHGDRRDHAERRAGDHVGGVEPAAEPDLQDQRVGGRLGEGQEGCRRRHLEERHGRAGVGALGALQQLDQLRLADWARLAVGTGDLDALMEAHQMRRGVDVHALAGCLQHGLQQRGGGALAVGAGDVDDRRQAVVRVAEPGQQRLDAAERQIDAPRVQRLHLGQQIVARAHGAPCSMPTGGQTPRRFGCESKRPWGRGV